MDIHDITTTMRQRNITIRKMARALHMNESVLGGILGGKRVLTERTRTLIELYLAAPQTLDADDIKQRMKQLGMSVAALAAELGITPDTLGRVLNGKQPMRTELQRHIALLLERGNDAPRRRRVMVLFEVEMPSSSVRMMIGADEAAMDVEEKRRCLESVIRGAMGELAKMGQDFEPVSRSALRPGKD